MSSYFRIQPKKTGPFQGSTFDGPEFYGDVIYKLRKIIGHGNFNTLFPKRIKRVIKRGYDPFFYNTLHVWLSALIQLAITLTSLVVRWKDGLSTPWWCRRRRISVLSLFGRALYGFSAVALTSDRSSSTLAIGWNIWYILITYLCFT